MPYDLRNLTAAYLDLGLARGDIVYVTGNLAALGVAEGISNKLAILEMHYKALENVLGKSGTIAFPTHSFSLCNTTNEFDLHNTVSESGILSEFLRQQHGAIRQFHPFSSISAIGKNALDICADTTRHAYGPFSPTARLIEADAKFVSIGMKPELTCSNVHHSEFCMGVPYRYSKEFMHPVVRSQISSHEPFYLFVTYLNIELRRDSNRKIFKYFRKNHEISNKIVDRGNIYCYSMLDFHESTLDLMRQDIYAWLEAPPIQRTFQT